MEILELLRQHYESYDAKAAQVRRETKGFGGIWGMGEDPRNHPCHVEFYDGVGQLVAAYLAGDPSGAEVAQAAKYILAVADARRNEDSYWFTFAAQGHVVPMIPRMDPRDCKELADWYDTRYKKLERMPIQRDMYKKLKARGKG